MTALQCPGQSLPRSGQGNQAPLSLDTPKPKGGLFHSRKLTWVVPASCECPCLPSSTLNLREGPEHIQGSLSRTLVQCDRCDQ